MKTKQLFAVLMLVFAISVISQAQNLPQLKVSDNGHYLQTADGKPFFYQGDTAWELFHRLNREEADIYLKNRADKGYNVIQAVALSEVDGVNVDNAYGYKPLVNRNPAQPATTEGENNDYWDNVDYIVAKTNSLGMYVGLLPTWGRWWRDGDKIFNPQNAEVFGRWIAERYHKYNVIWILGGDRSPDDQYHKDIIRAMARGIRSVDKVNLMTFHPRGRTMSATWFNDREWLDFNMFQSGHRRYGQRNGDADYPIEENTEEDNWRYVEKSLAMKPMKPVIDDEPIYENIPQGLHDPNEVRWNQHDVRRYAYWSVFAGAFGHTYGNNEIMQFIRPGVNGAYGADGRKKAWWDALEDPGFNQMIHLKNLMLSFPFFERIPDQSVIAGQNGERYDRAIATRGKDYLLVYNYSARPMEIDLTKVSGSKKNVWWYHPADGKLEYVGEFDNRITLFQYPCGYMSGNDRVLIAVDATKDYLNKEWTSLPDVQQKWNE